MDRRAFLAAGGAYALSYAFSRPGRARARLFIHWHSDDGSSRALQRGVVMGTEEARRAAAMFGGEVTVLAGDEASPPDAIHVWIVESPDRLADFAKRGSSIVFNVADRSEAIRSSCHPTLFHIAPDSSAKAEAVLWHPSLKRFGADTLNKRFEARWKEPLTSEAWAGWFSVKAAFEATLQSRGSIARDVIAWLEKPTARFDGHKGVALSFNARRELVQPLYYLEGAEVRETEPLPNSGNTATCR